MQRIICTAFSADCQKSRDLHCQKVQDCSLVAKYLRTGDIISAGLPTQTTIPCTQTAQLDLPDLGLASTTSKPEIINFAIRKLLEYPSVQNGRPYCVNLISGTAITSACGADDSDEAALLAIAAVVQQWPWNAGALIGVNIITPCESVLEPDCSQWKIYGTGWL